MPISPKNLKALSEFAGVAGEYCALIDSMRDGRPAKLYRRLESLLGRLHSAILPVEMDRPDKEHPEFGELETPREKLKETRIGEIVGPEMKALFEWHQDIAAKVGQNAGCVDPDAARADMLWDDLGDIYLDLHIGLSLWRLNTPDSQAEASWQWRCNYEIHWGEHLFRAAMTVHEARYQLVVD